jgi:glycerol-3-phosphate cytidylyltransferase
MVEKTPKMRIGFTASAWDLCHAGHIMALEEAKQQCDYLIVGLHIDPTIDRPNKNKPVQTIVERYAQLSAVKWVDEIVPYMTEADLVDILSLYPINVRILGAEYKGKSFTGKDICADRGIEIYFNQRDHRFSSSGLRKQVATAELNSQAKN